MNIQFKYQSNNYFNSLDYYIIKGHFNDILCTQIHLYNGYWYSNEGLQYKMLSIQCIKFNEIKGKSVYLDNIKGIINNILQPNNLGIYWLNGEQIRKYGLPHFWNNIKTLTI